MVISEKYFLRILLTRIIHKVPKRRDDCEQGEGKIAAKRYLCVD
jgi:hypothetical protein